MCVSFGDVAFPGALPFGLVVRERSPAEPLHADLALLRAAGGGETSACATLARRLLPRWKLAARRHAERMAEVTVEDLVHEAWLVVCANDFARLRRWAPDRGASLDSFAVMIAEGVWMNMAVAARRDKRGGRLRRVDDAVLAERPTHVTPETALRAQQDAQALLTAFATRLPPRGQLIATMYYVDGLSIAEIVRALSTTPQVVSNWLFKARAIAREILFD